MKKNRIYLIHIRDCLIKIKSYTKEGKLAFLEKSIIHDAVMRNLEVMSQSIKKLPDEWKQSQPHILWGKIISFKNRLAHDYLSIDLEIVWEIIENDLPLLETAIEQIAEKFWHL